MFKTQLNGIPQSACKTMSFCRSPERFKVTNCIFLVVWMRSEDQRSLVDQLLYRLAFN